MQNEGVATTPAQNDGEEASGLCNPTRPETMKP